MPVIKTSSWGNKGRTQERAHLRYINRFGTLCDETGAQIMTEDEALDSGRYDFSRRTTSVRLVISLPKERTEEAIQAILDELRQRYPQFVFALHEKNDAGEHQPHLHVDIMSHRGWAWRNARGEWKSLKSKLDAVFKARGLSFGKKKRIYQSRTQSEIHLRARGGRTWKDDMARGFEKAMREVAKAANIADALVAGDIVALAKTLLRSGLQLAHRGEKTMTLTDKDDNRCRIGRIYPGVRGKDDIEKILREMREEIKKTQSHTARKEEPQPKPSKAWCEAVQRNSNNNNHTAPGFAPGI